MICSQFMNNESFKDALAALFAGAILKADKKRAQEVRQKVSSVMDLLLVKHEPRLIKVARKLFEEQRRIVLANMKRTEKRYISKNAIDFYMFPKDKYDEEWEKETKEFLEKLVASGATNVMGALGMDFNFDPNDPNVEKFIADRAYKVAQQVNDTTEQQLRDALIEGMGLGENLSDLTARVNVVFDGASSSRAQMIARTETIKGSNFAAEAAFRQSDVVEGKEWVTAEDDTVCEFCMAMDEQVKAIGEKFFALGDVMTVGEGEDAKSLEFEYEDVENPPLHPGCRCTIVPVFKEIEVVSGDK